MLKFNEGHDQVFVTGSTSIAYDSNINATESAVGDTITTAALGMEYQRRAGMIGVNGELLWTVGQFAANSADDFSNPSLNLEFVKDKGRTTGSLTFSAARQSQADASINQRTVSWNYNAGFNWKYPVIERYSLAGALGYGMIEYPESGGALANLTTKSASTDLYYAYTSQRDLFAGYRIRESDTSVGSQTIDHALTGGVSGKVLPKLHGNVRAGYQIREESASGKSFGSTTASASLTWAATKRFSITATIEKDFTTTATDSSVDTLSANLNAQYILNSRWNLFAGVGAGESTFLNGADPGRIDDHLSWNVGVGYSLNEHFKASLAYSHFLNWSNRTGANFERDTITLSLSTRW